MNGFDLIAQCLKKEGVTWMGCFPANPLIEAVSKVDIRPVVFRQERGAINAVDGYSRQMRGTTPGIYASQSGPGVENSFGGIAQPMAKPFLSSICHSATDSKGMMSPQIFQPKETTNT